jgi:hypothetical protein
MKCRFDMAESDVRYVVHIDAGKTLPPSTYANSISRVKVFQRN